MTMNRRVEAASTVSLLSVLLGTTTFLAGCCQPGYPCQNSTGSIGPSKTEVVLAAVGIGVGGAVVATAVYEVNHSHHNVKGCVSTGPNGLELANDWDKKTYALVGESANLKAGEKVRLHGKKEKKLKGDPGNQRFLVEKVTKDLGPCQVAVAYTTTQGTPAMN
jgi:hypothetical protein